MSTTALERRIDALAALARLQRAQLRCELAQMRLGAAAHPWQIALGLASAVLSWWPQHRRATPAPWLALVAAVLAAWRQPRD